MDMSKMIPGGDPTGVHALAYAALVAVAQPLAREGVKDGAAPSVPLVMAVHPEGWPRFKYVSKPVGALIPGGDPTGTHAELYACLVSAYCDPISVRSGVSNEGVVRSYRPDFRTGKLLD